MSIFSKIRENAKGLKAAKQKQKQKQKQQQQTATVEKQTPELEKEKDAQPQPQPQAEIAPIVAVQEVKQNEAQPAVTRTPSKRASWRPGMNRTKSSESANKRMSAPALRSSASAPSLRALKHRSSDLSIESVMLSSDFPMPAAKQGSTSTDTMTLKSRNSLLAPNQFTYDPSKTPAFVGRKKGRPRRLHPSSRSSSFIRLQQIEPMAEENEDGETVDSSSTSTKSGSSGSSARSQYLEKKRSAQSSANTLSDPASSSRRASWASSDRSASSVSDIPPIAEVAIPVPVVHVQVQVAFADPPVTTTIPPPTILDDEDDDDDDEPPRDAAGNPVVSVMEDTPPTSPLPTRSTFSLRKKRSCFRRKHDSGTVTIF
ncbi:hypothetical protein HDK90DRAFT_227002 [Phyllosticta capitalensis]|uniref:Uncharacterized protein n=1 Tax=Phyllosticta capitalensis TaxID=121624 RepID=A0ABR1YU67_9PEZI